MGVKSASVSATKSRVNKTALVMLTVIGAVIGLAPITIFIEKPLLPLFIALASALTAVVEARKLEPVASNSPRFPEFLLGGVSSIYLPAIAGAMFFFLYIVAYGIAALIRYLLLLFGAQTGIDPVSIAQIFIVGPTVFFSFSLGMFVERLYTQLYPSIAGLKSVFYGTISRRRGGLIGCTVASTVGLGTFLTIFLAKDWIGGWFYFLLSLFLVVVSMPLWSLEGSSPRPTTEAEAIQKLFKAAEYTIVPAPRTGNSAIDPLLLNVDLLAYNDEYAFAVQVRVGTADVTSLPPADKAHQDSAPKISSSGLDWTAASTLQTAAWKLVDAGQEFGLTGQPVEPIMILINTVPDESLRAFSATEGFRVEELDLETLGEILRADNIDKLRTMARQHLRLPTTLQASHPEADDEKEVN